jgi:hypothetical protein
MYRKEEEEKEEESQKFRKKIIKTLTYERS